MARTGARGRPIEPLVLSTQERTYLERQVRRHRVARSLSERCRVILRCADGLAEIMHHEARFFVRLLRRRAAAIRPAGSV